MKLYLLIGVAVAIITEITMWVHTWDIVKEAYEGAETVAFVATTVIMDLLIYTFAWPWRVFCIVIAMYDNWEEVRKIFYCKLAEDEEES